MRLNVDLEIPTRRELIEQWSLAMRARQWHLDIYGHAHTISYIPSAAEDSTWRVTTSGNPNYVMGESLEVVLTLLADKWHPSIAQTVLTEQLAVVIDHADPSDDPELPETWGWE